MEQTKPEELSSSLISKAKSYAIIKHFDTHHKYDGMPYDVHLNKVYLYGCKYHHLLPSNKVVGDVLAACWAHDVIEDCRETYNDVEKVLGEDVANIVYALTNEKGRNRAERANEKYYEGIRNTPYASFVKICDRLANISHSKETNNIMISVYRKEHFDFVDKLFDKKYKEMFDEMKEKLF